MSIKKLFESTDNTRNYQADTTQKELFDEVESARNASAVYKQQQAYIAPVDYGKPAQFARYGSAYLYYDSAIKRVINYYPYDGSDAEINEFVNKGLYVDKYVFDNVYPRTTGYINLSADGWGTLSSMTNGYGLSDTLEYITFDGGPGTGSFASGSALADMTPQDYTSQYQFANVYDENIYINAGYPSNYGSGSRESNLKSDFGRGVTLEFWAMTGSENLEPAYPQFGNQVLVDVWNNNASSEHNYGRITVELSPSASSPAGQPGNSPFLLTVQSGTAGGTPDGVFQQTLGGLYFVSDNVSASHVNVDTLSSWHHYAIVLQNSGSDLVTKFYVDGVLKEQALSADSALGELPSKNMQGRLGALLTSPYGTSAPAGSGKLSGSMDEFRFWKVGRNARQIGTHWFTQVRGGVNTDISNTTLGLYYKFNEGITTTTSIDSVVLDYGGRIANGVWTGYTSNSRNTGSAIVSASAASTEYHDPIIHETHPDVVSLKDALLSSGSYHDRQNNNMLENLMPEWIISEHRDSESNHLSYLSHILGAYFDKIFLQISSLPTIKTTNYPSASHKPVPFAEHLPQSLGLYTPDIFIDATVMEKFLNRNDTELFSGDLEETKNVIYTNLYNNLTNIFKSKGTERSIRNVFRCFNVDEKLLRLNVYTNNEVYELQNNLIQQVVNKKFLNFNSASHENAVVYQRYSSSNGESQGYIGEAEEAATYGYTVETDITFPRYNQLQDNLIRESKNISLFGCYTVDTGSADSKTGAETMWVSNYGTIEPDLANFQISAVKDSPTSKNVYFRLTSSNYPMPIVGELTSSTFLEVYDDERWNISLRVKPSIYPYATILSGTNWGVDGQGASYNYDVIFHGTNAEQGGLHKSFTLTSSMTREAGEYFARSAKRLYAGARRTNLTGTVQDPSDVLFSSLKYWGKFIDDHDLSQHTQDFENYGVSNSYRNISALSGATGPIHSEWVPDMMNLQTLALNWNFANVPTSDGSGNFYTTDISSGSTLIRDNYGWLGGLSGYQHTGYGYGFPASSKKVTEQKAALSERFINPEMAVSSDMIRITSDDDETYGTRETIPNYFYTLEKSLYNAISEEMLDFFAGVIDFNNLIGAPHNRYRERYKYLEKLREVFFRRVQTVSSVEKYIEYYKWFDDALSIIISQLVPASADFLADTLNIVESHVLERNKYKTPFPTLEFDTPDLNQALKGFREASYNWEQGSSIPPTSPRNTKVRLEFWKERALRSSQEITARRDLPGDTTLADTIDSQRETIRKVSYAAPHMSQSFANSFTPVGTPYQAGEFAKRSFTLLSKEEASISKTIHGGTNFPQTKNIHFTYDALYPAGPVNQAGGIFVPENVLFGDTEDLVALQKLEMLDSNPSQKTIFRTLKVQHGRDWHDGLGKYNVKSTVAFPFNIVSSSVTTGYNKAVIDLVTASIEITNLHNDAYGLNMEVPMQGPFTNAVVGGHQSRHVPLNYGADGYTTRPEAWKILLGKCNGITTNSGAIAMVSPDYPWPEANDEDENPYPMTASQKAVYYRDFISKSPVNIKNIRVESGSTPGSVKLGNFRQNYEVVSTVGASANPRWFIDHQPALPTTITDRSNLTSSNVVGTIFAVERAQDISQNQQPDHFNWDVNYLVTDNSSSADNRSVITQLFSAPGGRDTGPRMMRDLRSGEYSVYNTINNRNLQLIKPSQGPSGTLPVTDPPCPDVDCALTASTYLGYRVFDIHGKPYGMRSLLARHSGRFGRDSLWVTGGTYAAGGPGSDIDMKEQLPSFQKVNRNNLIRGLEEITLEPSYGGDVLYNQYFAAFSNSSGVDQTGTPAWGATERDLYRTGSCFLLTASTPQEASEAPEPTYGENLVAAFTSSGFTYSGWLNMGAHPAATTIMGLTSSHNYCRFFQLGMSRNGGEDPGYGTWATPLVAIEHEVPPQFTSNKAVQFVVDESNARLDFINGQATSTEGTDIEFKDFTLSTWFKNEQHAVSPGNRSLITLGYDGSPAMLWAQIDVRSDNQLRLYQRWQANQDSAATPTWITWETVSGSVPNDSWAHLALSFNEETVLAGSGTGLPQVWINGVEQTVARTAAGENAKPAVGLVPLATEAYSTIGQGGGQVLQNRWEGLLAEMSYFSGSFGEAQAMEIYNSGAVADLTQLSTFDSDDFMLHSWWRMGDDANDVINAAASTAYSFGSNSIVDQMNNHHAAPWQTRSPFIGPAYNPTIVTDGVASSAEYLQRKDRLKVIIGSSGSAGGTSGHTGSVFYITGTVGGTAMTDISGSWYHIAATWDGTDGALSTAAPVLYVNGISQSYYRTDTPYDNYWGAETYAEPFFMKFFDGACGGSGDFTTKVQVSGNNFMVFGGNHSPSAMSYTGSMDEISLWTRDLDASEISTLYNSGKPCDVTASSMFTTEPTDLFDWYRMENPAGGGEEQIVDPTNPGTISDGNRILGFPFDAESHPNNNQTVLLPVTVCGDAATQQGSQVINFSSQPSWKDSVATLTACTQTIVGYTEVKTVVTASNYDNFNVQHQIPRMDRQYAWVTNSLSRSDDLRYYGTAPVYGPLAGLYSSSTDGYEAFFNYVTGSDAGRAFPHQASGTLYQPTTRLNLVVIDPVDLTGSVVGQPLATDGSTAASINQNNWGSNTAAGTYINTELTGTEATTNPADYLNLLLTRRGNTYGWNWKALRQHDHPLLMAQRSASVITFIGQEAEGQVTYRLPPVSLRGRPVILNISVTPTEDGGAESATLKATHNNEEIFFNDMDCNELLAPDPDQIVTPYEQLSSIYQGSFNWVLYSENLFPSLRNEFSSSITTRPGYDNQFWRDKPADRVSIGSGWVSGSGIVQPAVAASGSGLRNSWGIGVNQSCWPLDAAEDFLTRTFITKVNGTGSTDNAGDQISLNKADALRLTGSAGELQNGYFHTFNNAMKGRTSDDVTEGTLGFAASCLSPGALYARKHMLPQYTSVVGPNGPLIAETASICIRRKGTALSESGTALNQLGTYEGNTFNGFACLGPWGYNRNVTGEGDPTSNRRVKRYPVELYAGEAYWDAPAKAGIVIFDQDGSASFESYPSKPWYNDYKTYHHDLKLKARGYSIVPEFRISEHVESYIKEGLFNPSRFNTFSIPGTGINSTTSSFYQDYSNSEFMTNFLKVKADTLLGAKEIRLVCSAAIKFNPYKGFYPAQRTLDLTSQFSRSFSENFTAMVRETAISNDIAAASPSGSQTIITLSGTLIRPALQPFFAPGILYNSIKSGIAVDYPIINDPSKMLRSSILPVPYGDDDAGTWAAAGTGSQSYVINSDAYGNAWGDIGGYAGGEIWDKRIPFEAIIDPPKYLGAETFLDMEVHPSAALSMTASWNGQATDGIYTLMARNFFGEVGNFFLKDSGFTKLQSSVVPNDMEFDSGSVYMARVKLRRSVNSNRTYEYESGSYGDNTGFTQFGAAVISGSLSSPPKPSTAGSTGADMAFPSDASDLTMLPVTVGVLSSSYPLPQDPQNNPLFKETFTMYSRPTAFGPPVGGTAGNANGVGLQTFQVNNALHYGIYDSFLGVNPAFTPPYYDGECWLDLIFRPQAGSTYDLNKILAETKTQAWRWDPGISGSGRANSHLLIYGFGGFSHKSAYNPPYCGANVNANSMQMSSSINVFGVEDVNFQEKDKFGKLIGERNTTVGKRWVIQPKWETPMMNFNDEGVRPITNAADTLSVPTYGSASAARGMWHQFGAIPESAEKGVFLEIGDIPSNWLRYHYMIINSASVYNNFDSVDVAGDGSKGVAPTNVGPNLYKKTRSLTDLVGFTGNNAAKRLGELADSRTIREAVVAIPYILERADATVMTSVLEAATTPVINPGLQMVKKFIEIPKEQYEAALPVAKGSEAGDSLEAAGESIRKLIQKMDRYVLPPEFDFINNPQLSAMVMYMFEFEYTLDKDDLAYIWQNLAPRNFEKLSIEHQSVAHELMDLELLGEHHIMDNDNLRWMVFKVKQKAQTDYYDLITPQADVRASSITDRFTQLKPLFAQNETTNSTYKIGFNWPYDYLSLVEQIKFDAEVLYKPDGAQQQLSGEFEGTQVAVPGVLGAPPLLRPQALTPETVGETIREAAFSMPLQAGGGLVQQKATTRRTLGKRSAAKALLKGKKTTKKATTKSSTKKSTKKY